MLQLAAVVTQGDFSTGNQAEGTITAGLADSTKNAYFLKMISVATGGGQVINYSNRFSISGMTGTAAATYKDAVPGGTDGPDGEDNAANNADSGAATSAAGTGDGVPYPLQTGLTKYAPMQPIPPTKITKKQYSPLYPTSAVTIATTWLPTPSIVTTVTASQTFSVSSMENTVCHLSNEILRIQSSVLTFYFRLPQHPTRTLTWPNSLIDGRIRILRFFDLFLHTNYCVYGGVFWSLVLVSHASCVA